MSLIILLNKSDKLKRGAVQNTLKEVRGAIHDAYPEFDNLRILPFSAATGDGLEPLLSLIEALLEHNLPLGTSASPV